MGWFDNISSGLQNAVSNPLTYAAPTMALPWTAMGSSGGSSSAVPDPSATASADRDKDLNAGYAKGNEIFYDPEMQAAKGRLTDLSKGYNGTELGALRSEAQNQVQGQRSGYLKQLSSNSAKAGVGGARKAAMAASADQGYLGQAADADNKLTAQNATLIRQGNQDLNDFMMKQKYGALTTGLGYGQLGVADRTASANAAAASQQPQQGFLGSILDKLV